MMRAFLQGLAPLALAVLLAGCSAGDEAQEREGQSVELPIGEATPVDSAAASDEVQEGEGAVAFAAEAAAGVTPMADRVATIGLLNKRNNLSQTLEIKPGEAFEDGPVIIRLAACERTPPHEFPPETGAFVQVDVQERGASSHARVFSGWLFKENPSLNVVEHPIYDVWVKDCAMRFPGDE